MIQPMLACKYTPHRVTFPCFIQPKLNGVRGIYDPRCTPHFQSRYGERWSQSIVQHALSPLTKLGNVFLDGEFYRHGMSLQEINSRIAVVRTSPHKEGALIPFNVFDIIARVSFRDRWKLMHTWLREKFEDVESVNIVETREVFTPQEADYWYNQWKNVQGFEGLMYRDADAVYGLSSQCGNKENRWWHLQKRKEMLDMECEVLGLNEMVDKDGERKDTLGSFTFETSEGIKFTAGSGLTMQQRHEYWHRNEEMIGTRCRVLYETLSDGGVPHRP